MDGIFIFIGIITLLISSSHHEGATFNLYHREGNAIDRNCLRPRGIFLSWPLATKQIIDEGCYIVNSHNAILIHVTS